MKKIFTKKDGEISPNLFSLSKPVSVVILYYSGTKEDDEDTREAARGIFESLKRSGYPVRKVQVTMDNWETAVKTPGEVVFNLVEDDTWDLYMKVGRRLEEHGRAQVGHNLSGLKYATIKAPIKRRMKDLGISTPKFNIFTSGSVRLHLAGLKFPLIVKPSHQHAGIGISQHSVVTNESELTARTELLFKEFPGEVIAEEYIRGREIHVTLLGNDNKVLLLPYCEIGFGGKFNKNWSVYTYEAKWDKKSWEYWDARVDAPAKMSRVLSEKIRKLALKTYKAFQAVDIARFDFRVDSTGRPYIIDLNMNPSLNYYDEQDATLASVYAYHWTYDHFIKTLVALAYRRVYPEHLSKGLP